MKKVGKRKSKTAKLPARAKAEKSREADGEMRLDAESEGKTDYGGLPAIDLKKNLGCG
ncbi:MAG: hypothetical protein WEB30_10600 [Cyclobacteriaceae bacterium]